MISDFGKSHNNKNYFSGFWKMVFIFFCIGSFAFTPNPKSEIRNRKSLHAFHTSITQIDYISKSKTYEISVRIFTDDFEKAIERANKKKDIKIEDGDKNDTLISNYISSHFVLTSPSNKKIYYKYIGKENEDQATWIYLELVGDLLIKGTKIQQNVLLELYDDQVNILNYRHHDERKTLLFDLKNKVRLWE